MKFLIISHVKHSLDNGQIFGYGPFVKEINLWLKHVDEVRIVAPMSIKTPDPIDLAYLHENIHFDKVPAFNLISICSNVTTLILLPFIFFRMLRVMIWADHIHLRCPWTRGLLGAVAKVFFPWQNKTVNN